MTRTHPCVAAATTSSLRIHAVALRTARVQSLRFINRSRGDERHRLSDELQAGDLVSATATTVSRIQTLREAAQRIVERGVAHLIVIDEASSHPVGVLSTTSQVSELENDASGAQPRAPARRTHHRSFTLDTVAVHGVGAGGGRSVS